MKIDVRKIKIKTGVPLPTNTGKFGKIYAMVNRMEVDQSLEIPMPDTTFKQKVKLRANIRNNYEGDDHLITRVTDDSIRVWCVEKEEDE